MMSLMFPDWMSGRHARSEAWRRTQGLDCRPRSREGSGVAAYRKEAECWPAARSDRRRCSCVVLRPSVVLIMEERLGLREPEMGLRCWISRWTCRGAVILTDCV